MGKGSKRREEDTAAVRDRWPFEDRFEKRRMAAEARERRVKRGYPKYPYVKGAVK